MEGMYLMFQDPSHATFQSPLGCTKETLNFNQSRKLIFKDLALFAELLRILVQYRHRNN